MLHTHTVIHSSTTTLYNVFLQALQFPLSVSFHQCSILIHSFIHLPPTLYNVFLPVLQFPLSVSFYQCSILIHSFIHSFIHLPPTLYNVFLPVLQFPLSVSFYQCSILIHSFIYHPRSITFFSQYCSFPCQYHSTNAPYSFQLHDALIRKTSGRSLWIFQQERSFENWGALQTEVLSLSFLFPSFCTDCAIPQAIGRRGPGYFQVSPYKICCAQSDTATRSPHRPVRIALSAPSHLATPLVLIFNSLLSQGQTCELYEPSNK